MTQTTSVSRRTGRPYAYRMFLFMALALITAVPLTELSLAGNRLTTARDLQGLTNLKVLDISDNADITLTSYLANLKKLEYLDISGNKGIVDVTPLYGLTNLRQLDVSNTGLTWEQVSELASRLSGCQVLTDLSEPTSSPSPTAEPTPAPTAAPTPTPAPEIVDET